MKSSIKYCAVAASSFLASFTLLASGAITLSPGQSIDIDGTRVSCQGAPVSNKIELTGSLQPHWYNKHGHERRDAIRNAVFSVLQSFSGDRFTVSPSTPNGGDRGPVAVKATWFPSSPSEVSKSVNSQRYSSFPGGNAEEEELCQEAAVELNSYSPNPLDGPNGSFSISAKCDDGIYLVASATISR